MDNLTHSLTGVAVAEVACQVVSRKRSLGPKIRGLLYFVSIFANNFPDLDLLYRFLDPSRLGYLMHHRGHTHTFVWIWPQVALLLSGIFIFCRWKKISITKKDSFLFLLIAGIGLHLHIGLDFLNSYGVHPLSPFDNHWSYGDTLFIMEPLVWAALIPLAMRSIHSWWKLLFVVPGLVLFFLGLYTGLLQLVPALVIFGFGLLYWLGLKTMSPIFRPFISVTLAVFIVFMFWFSGRKAETLILKQTSAQHLAHVYDVAVSPMPGNPFCWFVLLVDGNKETYRVHAGLFKHQSFLSPKKCPMRSQKMGVHLEPSVFSSDISIKWLGRFETSVNYMSEEVGANCQLKAWYQFIRVPHRSGATYSDLRFSLKGGSNFSTFDVAQQGGEACPPYPVPWVSPRTQALGL